MHKCDKIFFADLIAKADSARAPAATPLPPQTPRIQSSPVTPTLSTSVPKTVPATAPTSVPTPSKNVKRLAIKLSQMQRVVFLQQLCFLRVYDRTVDAVFRQLESNDNNVFSTAIFDAVRRAKGRDSVAPEIRRSSFSPPYSPLGPPVRRSEPPLPLPDALTSPNMSVTPHGKTGSDMYASGSAHMVNAGHAPGNAPMAGSGPLPASGPSVSNGSFGNRISVNGSEYMTDGAHPVRNGYVSGSDPTSTHRAPSRSVAMTENDRLDSVALLRLHSQNLPPSVQRRNSVNAHVDEQSTTNRIPAPNPGDSYNANSSSQFGIVLTSNQDLYTTTGFESWPASQPQSYHPPISSVPHSTAPVSQQPYAISAHSNARTPLGNAPNSKVASAMSISSVINT